jgi:hypothetical protein
MVNRMGSVLHKPWQVPVVGLALALAATALAAPVPLVAATPAR